MPSARRAYGITCRVMGATPSSSPPSHVLMQMLVSGIVGKSGIRLHDDIQGLPEVGCTPGLIRDDRRQQSQGIDWEPAT